jgi:hypothetical protein
MRVFRSLSSYALLVIICIKDNYLSFITRNLYKTMVGIYYSTDRDGRTKNYVLVDRTCFPALDVIKINI